MTVANFKQKLRNYLTDFDEFFYAISATPVFELL